MNVKLLLPPIVLLSISLLQAEQLYQLNPAVVSQSEQLDEITVLFDKDSFYLAQNNEIKPVQNCFIDPVIKTLHKREKLDSFFQKGCKIAVKQMEDGEFKLNAVVPGLGGGPVCAAIGYWLIKGGFYTAVSLGVAVGTGAAAAATVATAGAAAPALAAAATVAAGAPAVVGGLGVVSGLATAGAGVAIATTATGAAAGATIATGIGAVGAAGGVVAAGGIIAGVETASAGFAAFLLALPIP